MRSVRGVYEGPGSHGSLRVAASMRRLRTVLRAYPEESYFPALHGAHARAGDLPPISLSPIREKSEELHVPGNLAHDLEGIVHHYPHTDAVFLARSEAALLAGEQPPDVTLPDSPQTGRKVKLVTCGWEKPGVGEHEAADLAVESLVRSHAAPHERSAAPTVNIFGPPIFAPGAEAEYREAERLLALIGVSVNARVPLGASVEELVKLPRAWANLLLCREFGDAATLYLQEQFGMKRVVSPMIGASGTGAALRTLGELCSIDGEKVRRVIFSELAHTARMPWYSRLTPPEVFRGRRVSIFGDFTHAVGLGYTLSREVGLEVATCGTYLKNLGEDLLFQAGTFTEAAFVSDDPEEVADRLKRSDPDVLIGTYLEEEVADALGVPFLPLCPPAARQPLSDRPLMGYSGAATIADAADEALRRARSRPETREEPGLPWTEEALAELEEIPAFLRGRARRLAEEHAREVGAPRITRDVLDEARL